MNSSKLMLGSKRGPILCPNRPVPKGLHKTVPQYVKDADPNYELPRSESARQYFRTVYDFPNWQKHRRTTRLIDRLLQIPQSHIMQNIVPSVAWCTTMATLVAGYMQAYNLHMLPDAFPSLSPNQACSSFISTTSVALSLLLVFRTNAGYGRWDEARKMWGLLVNRSRDLLRQGVTCFPDDEPEAKAALARWMIATVKCLRMHFQPEVSIDDQLRDVLKPAELEDLKKSAHKPTKCIQALSLIIQRTKTHPIHQMQMSTNLTAFHDVLGGCERILRAPIPVSYTRHTARFLFVWLTTLPFALYPNCGVWTIPVTASVAAVLCGIEEIGVQAEEPFGILPLEAIAKRIELDVLQTVQDDEQVKKVLLEAMAMDIEAEKAKLESMMQN